ncbi:hypothetical protein ACFWXK_39190 [Streptomyces sp. NPDC059070]|uniref:hypothetical protein n=1 Tax=unclassified Streptomyces TaxID=2593676 RepID=UPI0034E2AE0B
MARNHAGGAGRGRALLRAGLTVTAAGAALTGAGAPAQAATDPATAVGEAVAGPATAVDAPTRSVTGDLSAGVKYALAPAKTLRLNPFAQTAVDPLDNGVATQVGDFKPVTTAVATDPLHDSGALKDLPVIGAATGLLPG